MAVQRDPDFQVGWSSVASGELSVGRNYKVIAVGHLPLNCSRQDSADPGYASPKQSPTCRNPNLYLLCQLSQAERIYHPGNCNMSVPTPTISDSFFAPALDQSDVDLRARWYMCNIISLSSLNYPDVIPQVYEHFSKHVLSTLASDEERKRTVACVREGLIKSTGIVGAARTGNAMRILGNCIPENLRDAGVPLRSQESEDLARERGKRFWSNIYARNKDFDPGASVRASPDYAFVVRGMWERLCVNMFCFCVHETTHRTQDFTR
jgi:hypothetical protein